jgi:hypothetical protein
MTDATPPADPNAELDTLRKQNEELQQQLASQTTPTQPKPSSGPLWRRITAWVLAVLAVIAIILAVDAVWLKTFVSDREAFVSALEPLPKNEDVATVVSVRVADGIIEVAGVETFVAGTLPEQLTFLSAPLTQGITDFTSDAAFAVVTSDGFTTIWSGALGVTHTAVNAVLTGNDAALVAEGGRIAIDLDEAASAVVERIEAAGLELPELGEEIELGQIVILESEQLAAAQSAAQAVNTAGWVLPFLALLLIAGAIFVAPNRRHMTAVVGFGTALGLLLSLAAFRITRRAILSEIEEEASYNAAAAVWDTVLRRLIQGTWAILMLAFIVGFVAWLAGPSPRAARLRGWYTRTVDQWRRPAEADPGGFAGFVMEWKRTIQVVIVVLGLLFVLFGPAPSGWLVLVTTAVVLMLLVLVEVIGGPAVPPQTASAEPQVEVPATGEDTPPPSG